jgi:hypothetical protein
MDKRSFMGAASRFLIAGAVAITGGCATSYQLSVMPRDSGKVYTGVADDAGYGEGRVSITIENKAYTGTWVQSVPDRTTGWVSGGFGFGRWGHRGGLGTYVTIENPQGGEVKALLTAADGTGLRCDFRSGYGHGGGLCRDDRGREYDVQIRPAPRG